VKNKICKTIILPVVLCRCETLSRILREEHRLRVFENRVLRRIFVSKKEEVMRCWRKLHNEELHNLNQYRWEDNSRMNLREIGCDSSGSGYGPLAGILNIVMNIWVLGSIKDKEFHD
jgi:hypothetical protein